MTERNEGIINTVRSEPSEGSAIRTPPKAVDR